MNKWAEVKGEGDYEEGEDNRHFWDRKAPLEGVLAMSKSNLPPNGNTLYAVENEMGERTYFWGSMVLDDKLNGLANGTIVRIEPQGRLQSRASNYKYWGYRVLIQTAPDDAEPELTDEEKEAEDLYLGREEEEI